MVKRMTAPPGCAEDAEWGQLLKHGKPAFLKWKALIKFVHEAEYILEPVQQPESEKNLINSFQILCLVTLGKPTDPSD